MKESRADYRCESCQKEFSQSYPIAETKAEYEECRKHLTSGYVVASTGHARRKIPCPNPNCRNRMVVSILDFIP